FCYSGVFAVAEHEYRDGNALLGSWCPGWSVSTSSTTVSRKMNNFFVVTPTATLPEVPGAQGGQYHVVSWILRSPNTNIVTLTLLEVPSAQGKIRYSRISGATEHGYGAILKIIPKDDVDTVYPGHQIPRKRLLSLYSYIVTSKTPNQRVSTKYVETTLIQPTLGAGYLKERCRRYIRVQGPQKSPINESGQKMSLIFHETPGDDVDTDNPGHREMTLILSTLWAPGTSESIAVAIFVFSDPKNPLVTKLYLLSSIFTTLFWFDALLFTFEVTSLL
ncbi:hypothetical protein TSAR_016513, partial [Trichomalopsis sarcophagae]